MDQQKQSEVDNSISVVIPYEPELRLAKAYNRAMQSACTEWVLILDHDLFFCNRYWYEMCIRAVKSAPSDCGWISAVTNRIGNKNQRAVSKNGLIPPENDDLEKHCLFAKKLYAEWGDQFLRCRGAMSGFFILTSRTAWRAAGGFDESRKRLLGVDNLYSRDLSRAGYIYYKLPGLYVYHIYRKKRLLMRW